MMEMCIHEWETMYNYVGGKISEINPTNGKQCKVCGEWKPEPKTDRELQWDRWADFVGDYR